jgi:hypothetical protein
VIPDQIQQTAGQQDVPLPLAKIVLNGKLYTLRDVAYLKKATGRESFPDAGDL